MKKNIIIVAAICVSVISAVILARLAADRFLAEENDSAVLPPGPVLEAPKTEPSAHEEIKDMLSKGEKAMAVKRLQEVADSEKGSRQAYESFLMLAATYKNDGNFTKAKEYYIAITNEYSEYCNYSQIQEKLNELNIAILFSKIPTKNSEIYSVVPGDSLTKIAKRYSTTVELIKRANGLKTDTIMPGQKFKVQKIPFSIVADKSQSVLTLILQDEVVKTYAVSTGKNNSTPTGIFQIKDKLVDPVWYSPDAVVASGSPDNILGTRWMGLTTPKPGYGIHGTTMPESIGYQATEGCVRMRNDDVEELYAIVPVGTEVTIID
ncbi:MAG: L,D-transpeptidase family protein [Candidatus Omnitrophota bacterium]